MFSKGFGIILLILCFFSRFEDKLKSKIRSFIFGDLNDCCCAKLFVLMFRIRGAMADDVLSLCRVGRTHWSLVLSDLPYCYH